MEQRNGVPKGEAQTRGLNARGRLGLRKWIVLVSMVFASGQSDCGSAPDPPPVFPQYPLALDCVSSGTQIYIPFDMSVDPDRYANVGQSLNVDTSITAFVPEEAFCAFVSAGYTRGDLAYAEVTTNIGGATYPVPSEVLLVAPDLPMLGIDFDGACAGSLGPEVEITFLVARTTVTPDTSGTMDFWLTAEDIDVGFTNLVRADMTTIPELTLLELCTPVDKSEPLNGSTGDSEDSPRIAADTNGDGTYDGFATPADQIEISVAGAGPCAGSPCDDGNDCTQDYCDPDNAGSCTHTLLALGTSCGSNPGAGMGLAGMCTGIGDCIDANLCPAPTPLSPGPCPAACTGGCVGDVCVIDCHGTDACKGEDLSMLYPIVCPDGIACRVECGGDQACMLASIRCSDTAPCEIECSDDHLTCVVSEVICPNDDLCELRCAGGQSCLASTLICGEGACTASCPGEFSNPSSFLVDCGSSCSCNSSCTEGLQVLETIPASAEADVATETTLSVRFGEALDETTVTTSSFTLYRDNDGTQVSGTVSVDGTSNTAFFIPDAPLETVSTYTATVTGAIEGLSGNSGWHSWTFTTVGVNLLCEEQPSPCDRGNDCEAHLCTPFPGGLFNCDYSVLPLGTSCGSNPGAGMGLAGMCTGIGDCIDANLCPAPTPLSPGPCPAACTGGCVGDVCVIDCHGTDACKGEDPSMLYPIVCPDGIACRVECGGDQACMLASIRCSDTAPCEIECSDDHLTCVVSEVICPTADLCELRCAGGQSCLASTLICGEGACTASCPGEFSNPLDFLVDCGSSCSCNSTCTDP